MERPLTPKQYSLAHELLQDFQRWSTYRDDLPEEILVPGDPDYDRYKCRTNFFSFVRANIEELLSRDILLEDEAIKRYLTYTAHERYWAARTTQEDIEKVNTVIHHVIAKLREIVENE